VDVEFMRIIADALWTATRITSPILLAALVIGVTIGLVQTVLQVQEATLTFVPKLLAIGIILAVSGNWMLVELEDFMLRSLDSIPALLAG
jgi:flagellar biosynthetic protein FliQ